ncbi:hypothetical protein VTN96DRAFT_6187 [Rasamsonia emersonii]
MQDELCPSCHQYPPHDGSFVIAVDGACSNNGRTGARAAAGVYFGKRSRCNKSFVLDPDLNPTSQVAELSAAIRTLEHALVLQAKGRRKGKEWQQVVIKADSEYLVKGMTAWIAKWKRNGYQNCAGKPVTNGELFCRLDGLVAELEEQGVQVQFWHVPRQYNQQANLLARRALNR